MTSPITTKTPSQALTEALALETPPEEIARALRNALTATMKNRDGTVSPDHRVQVQAAEIAIRFSVGLPVQRTEAVNVNLDADNSVGIEERLRHSPALRSMFRKMLDKAEGAGEMNTIATTENHH